MQEVVLQALEGTESSTMQLKGVCHKREAHTLIDTGASHNFVHPSLLKSAKAKIIPIKTIRVRQAGGSLLYTNQIAEIEMSLQGYQFKSYYVLCTPNLGK